MYYVLCIFESLRVRKEDGQMIIAFILFKYRFYHYNYY